MKELGDFGEYFLLEPKKTLKIKGIITYKLFCLLIKERFLVKIFYHGNLEGKKELIQLTIKTYKNNNENKEYILSEKCYNEFINYLEKNNSENIINLFNENNVGYIEEVFIKLKKGFLLYIKNECFRLKLLKEEKSKIQNKNFQPVNNLRLIGLVNVGATCYMNATLQCFINVDSLTKFIECIKL